MLRYLVGCIAALWLAQPAQAQKSVKIGFVSTFSGPVGELGEEILDGFRLALEHSGGKFGGANVEIVVGDDQTKPDVARQLVDKMIEQDRVDILTGMLNSSVLLSIARPALDAGKFVISSNAGPSQLAGKQCHPNFFNVTTQNDAPSEAVGYYLQAKGVKRVFLLAPNYPAGRDKMSGFKRYFKGEIVGEIYTPFNQLDYASEIAQVRAAKPEAVFEFLPGAQGINFLKQFHESGLGGAIRLTMDHGGLDQGMIDAVHESAVGAETASFWGVGMDNPVSKRFVAAYEERKKRVPSMYSAFGYDTGLLLDSALKATGGSVADQKALRKALMAADFASIRGKLRFNTNHFPLNDYYLLTGAKEDGRYVLALGEKILADHSDFYAKDCRMPAD